MFLANLVRYFTQFCPRSFVLLALIMLGGETKPVIQICVVENDVAMQVVFIVMNCDNILIIALKITVAKLLAT